MPPGSRTRLTAARDFLVDPPAACKTRRGVRLHQLGGQRRLDLDPVHLPGARRPSLPTGVGDLRRLAGCCVCVRRRLGEAEQEAAPAQAAGQCGCLQLTDRRLKKLRMTIRLDGVIVSEARKSSDGIEVCRVFAQWEWPWWSGICTDQIDEACSEVENSGAAMLGHP